MFIQSCTETISGKVPLILKTAETIDELEKVYRLRYEVFVQEEKADLINASHIEKDAYDDSCRHIIVMNALTGDAVGTYRLLSGKQAGLGIGFYSQSEFDLSPLSPWFNETIELGRSCVKKEYRNGKIISLLWKGIGQYILENRPDYLIGCASISVNTTINIKEIYAYLKDNYNSDKFEINPHSAFQIPGITDHSKTLASPQLFKYLPPLIKGYLRLGAHICGQPAYDPLFKTVDFFMLLDTNNIVTRYQNNYLKVV